MNQAVHAIDLFQWYMGPITEIFGRYATLLHGDYIDVEDTVVATVVFANGALGIIEAATTVKPDLGFKVAVHGTSNAMVSVWEQPEGNAGIIDLWTVQGQEEHSDVFAEGRERVPGFPEFHRLQIQDFVRAVQEDREPAVTGAEARKALEIILAIYQSSRTGLPVRLPRDAQRCAGVTHPRLTPCFNSSPCLRKALVAPRLMGVAHLSSWMRISSPNTTPAMTCMPAYSGAASRSTGWAGVVYGPR